ncbi:MAG: hypothetical protein EPN22_01500 [Nitrospirae bacterium]|nr:MAG: hypothetical protein EPN22_01500 [Nitrospirota bacterium]
MTNKIRVLTVALFLLFGIPSVVNAVVAVGQGINRDQALNNSLQLAVETVIGVAVRSDTLVENAVLIRDNVVTHAKGYISDYRILSETKNPDGSFTVRIDANVNKDLVLDHIQTLEILMKMAGHPRVLVFGIDDDIESVQAGGELSDPLVHTVSEVFGKKFRFDVLDWPTMRVKNRDIQGKLDRAKAIQNNNKFKADFMVTVKLNLIRKDGPARLIMSAVRVSDNFLLGEVQRDIMFNSIGTNDAAIARSAVAAAAEVVFHASADLAKHIVGEMQAELDRGKGFRYTLAFINFPDMSAVHEELLALSGYVRHSVDKSGGADSVLSYWSNLKSDTLLEEIKGLMKKRGYRYKFKLNGREIKFQWLDPVFE